MPEAREAPVATDSPSDPIAGDPLTDRDCPQPSPSTAQEPFIGSDPVAGSVQDPPDEPGHGSENGVEDGADNGINNGMDGYRRLQRRLILATLAATALAVPATALCFDIPTAGSLLIGALAGLLYIRLLARSVSRLGGDRKSVGKVQLLVPVVLVLAAARTPQLEIVPALLGFLLYKPALIVQAVLDS